MIKTPKVYILILNWNNAEDTIDCLRAVFKTDYPDYQVVLLDNGSADGSEEKIRQWVSGAGIGFARYDRGRPARGREANGGVRPARDPYQLPLRLRDKLVVKTAHDPLFAP